jgi:hypothetical protein
MTPFFGMLEESDSPSLEIGRENGKKIIRGMIVYEVNMLDTMQEIMIDPFFQDLAFVFEDGGDREMVLLFFLSLHFSFSGVVFIYFLVWISISARK